MRFKYTTTDSSQNEFDNLPRIPLRLRQGDRAVEALGLVDSGATVNVLPYEIGIELGAVWDESKAIIQLAGNLSNLPAMLSDKLIFSWSLMCVSTVPNLNLILSQSLSKHFKYDVI